MSKKNRSLDKGLGGGINTIPFVPAAVSCEEREANKASLSVWEGRVVIVSVLNGEAVLHTSDILPTPTGDPSHLL